MMRTSPKIIVSILATLLIGSMVIPIITHFENNIVNEILNNDEHDSEELNDAQKKALVDWERNGTSENFYLKQVGGIYNDYSYGIAVSPNGIAYIAGEFKDVVTLGDTTLTSMGNLDIFIAKLSETGEWLWAVSGGSIEDDRTRDITIDSNENVYVTGSYGDTALFGSLAVLNGGESDIFVVKLNKDGVWNWVNTAGGIRDDVATSIDIDSNKNVFITGYFTGTASFDNLILSSSGNEDIFVAKLASSNGAFRGVGSAGSSTGDDISNEIIVDSNGSIYIAGSFEGTAFFGSNSITSEGHDDMFIAKLTDNGTVNGQLDLIWDWVKGVGDSYGDDEAKGLAFDSTGNIYVTGSFKDTVTFGNTSMTSMMSDVSVTGVYPNWVWTYTYSSDIFVAKINSEGVWQWANSAGSSGANSYTSDGWDVGQDIAIDSNNDVFVTGFFESSANFGDLVATSSGKRDVFVAKINQTAEWQWVVTAGGLDEDIGRRIVIDSQGNCYISGSFQETTKLGNQQLTSNGNTDVFVAKMNIDGSSSYGWSSAYSTGGVTDDYSYSIDVDASGNAYITGKFENTMAFGITTLTSSGNEDIFIAKLSRSGTWLWALGAGGSGNDYGSSLAVSSNNIYITGSFERTANFGFESLTVTGNSNDKDVFVAKLTINGIWEWVVKAGGDEWDEGYSIDVDERVGAYVAGVYYSDADFGGIPLENDDNWENIFVGLIDPNSGQWQWVKRIYGDTITATSKLVVSTPPQTYTMSEVVIAGDFYGTINFDNPSSSFTLTSAGLTDIFVARLNETGEWQMVSYLGSGGDETLGDVVYDDLYSYIYISGTFNSPQLLLPGDNSVDITLLSSGTRSAFIASMSPWDGEIDWTYNPYNSGTVDAVGLTVDSVGAIYFVGNYNGIVFLNDGHYISTQKDNFIIKLSEEGDPEWEITSNGAGPDVANSIAINSYGEVFSTGSFKLGSNFGETSLVSNGDWDIFVAITSPDFDADSIPDINDEFPFEPSQQSDIDGDKFGDNLLGYRGDSCPLIFGLSWQDRWGCPDMDEDGQSDLGDAFMQQPTQWNDTDGDGLGDNWDGTNVDRNYSANGIGEYWPNAYQPDPSPLDYDNDGFEDKSLQGKGATGPYDDCPLIYGTSFQDVSGCIDSDSDGWSDTYDSHSGDGTQWNDTDGDGYGDNPFGNQPDYCPNQMGYSVWDVFGCPDMDGDGVSYLTDFNDNDTLETRDSDGDGIGDNSDECQYIWGNISEGNEKGCPDSDGDGIGDKTDQFPEDHTQYIDSDNDGYGDNMNGTLADSCPTQNGFSDIGGYGCPDTDRDGYGDSIDKFPVDSTQWNDTDDDGFGDSSIGISPDSCPEESGTSTLGDILGCIDSDGDGWADIIDLYPTKSTMWSDSDGDGFTDQLGHDSSDDCPGQAGDSIDMMKGCPDMDGDGLSDIYDDDTDGDGISNSIERQAGYDPYDNQNTPEDFDNDGIPDVLDDDDDDDGFSDDMENERGSKTKDERSTPLSMYSEKGTGVYYVPGQGFSSSYEENGYELSVSWAWNLVSSEFLVPIILLPLSVLLLMGKRRKFKKFKKKMNKIEDIEELEELEEDIDAMIEKGSVKVEHAMLLRNQFERRREKLSGKSHMDRLFKNSRNTVEHQVEERLGVPPNRGPSSRGAPSRGPPSRGAPSRGPPSRGAPSRGPPGRGPPGR